MSDPVRHRLPDAIGQPVVDSLAAASASLCGIESALFTALLGQENLGVGVCGTDGVLTMLNPALELMLGQKYAASAPSSWPQRFRFHDEDGRPLRPGEDPLARALLGETVAGQVLSVRRPRKAPRFLRCSAFQLRDPEGVLLGAVVLALDITETITEQARLAELRDRLVSAVNHEVRTPLSVIVGHLELIGEGRRPVSKGLAWSLAAIGRATAHLEDVVDTISEIADGSTTSEPRRAQSRAQSRAPRAAAPARRRD